MGEAPYAPAESSLAAANGAGLRCGAAALLTAVTSGLSLVREPRLVRERFEEEVRALLSARSVALRDEPAESTRHPNTISLDLPGLAPDRRARLEAVFDGTQRPDGWTRQVLEAGAHVAALLLELERAQGWRLVRGSRDGAAPLIGSSAAMQQVRDRIERVARRISRSWWKEHQAHCRTMISLKFSLRLPSTTARGRWRERGHCR